MCHAHTTYWYPFIHFSMFNGLFWNNSLRHFEALGIQYSFKTNTSEESRIPLSWKAEFFTFCMKFREILTEKLTVFKIFLISILILYLWVRVSRFNFPTSDFQHGKELCLPIILLDLFPDIKPPFEFRLNIPI